jgi:hypothetical protein
MKVLLQNFIRIRYETTKYKVKTTFRKHLVLSIVWSGWADLAPSDSCPLRRASATHQIAAAEIFMFHFKMFLLVFHHFNYIFA